MARTAFLVTSALAVAALGFQMSTAHGKHSWSNYHWWNTTAPVSFVLRHNVMEQWTPFLGHAKISWAKASDIDITDIVDTENYNHLVCDIANNHYDYVTNPGTEADRTVEVCSKSYGSTGWLGVARIWIFDDGHIIKGLAQLNDYYFDNPPYNTDDWRDLVMCQEVGHVFGLGHQDESFYNPEKVDSTGKQTCMDYTSRPEGNGEPNQHDYDQLTLIYNHNDDSADTVEDTKPGNGKGGGPKKGSAPGKLVAVSGFQFATYVRNDPSEWGTAVAFTDRGQPHVFVKDLDSGVKVVTHVTWTEDARAGRHFPHY